MLLGDRRLVLLLLEALDIERHRGAAAHPGAEIEIHRSGERWADRSGEQHRAGQNAETTGRRFVQLPIFIAIPYDKSRLRSMNTNINRGAALQNRIVPQILQDRGNADIVADRMIVLDGAGDRAVDDAVIGGIGVVER